MVRLWEQFRRNHVSLVMGQGKCWVTTNGTEVLHVPTRVLLGGAKEKVIAIGEDARPVEYSAQGKTRLVVPLTRDSVEDDRAGVAFLQAVLRAALGRSFFLKPQVRLSLSERATPFQRELWRSVGFAAGARSVWLASPLLAIAQGAGLLAQDTPYAVASWDATGASLGLIALQRVQFRQDVVWALDTPRAQQEQWLEELWGRFVRALPNEFAAQVMHDGVITASDLESTDVQAALTARWSLPVAAVGRDVELMGLHNLSLEDV